jgi:hypothetical protein
MLSPHAKRYNCKCKFFLTILLGSGCIAALEAEKYLAELEDGENDLEKEKTARKSSNVVVPEYRGNPLL